MQWAVVASPASASAIFSLKPTQVKLLYTVFHTVLNPPSVVQRPPLAPFHLQLPPLRRRSATAMFGRWSSQPWDKGNLRYESFPLADEASIPTEEQELQQELEDVAPLAGSSKPKSHWASLLPMWSDADTKPTEASGKRSLVYILAACGALAALFLIRLAFVPAVTDNKLLVLYAYHETVDARRNAEFFIRHGLHAKADFIFVLNGETDLDEAIPVVKNIRFIKRENTCYDLGAQLSSFPSFPYSFVPLTKRVMIPKLSGEVLSANDRALVKKYNKFILMNASIRGPFLPHWSSMCWSDAFANKVTETNKLVGMTMNCLGGSRPHLQVRPSTSLYLALTQCHN